MYRIQVAPGSFIDVQEAAAAIATTLNSPATTPCNSSSPPGFCTATGSNFSTAACAGQPYSSSSSSSSSTPLYCASVGHSWALATKVPGITSCDVAYAASQVVKDGLLEYVSSLVIDPVVLLLPELNVRCFAAVAVSMGEEVLVWGCKEKVGQAVGWRGGMKGESGAGGGGGGVREDMKGDSGAGGGGEV